MASDTMSMTSTNTEKPVEELLNVPLRKRRGSSVSFVTANSSVNKGPANNVPSAKEPSVVSAPSVNSSRRSTLKSCAQGVMGMLRIRRLTMSRGKPEVPKTEYENTYRLEPETRQKFSAAKVQKTAEDVLSNYLENKTYNERTCGTLACNVADIIKNRIKDLNIPRYRILCQVVIGEENGQGFEAASMSVWNDKTDNYACASFKNNSLFALAMIHGVYLE